MPVSSFADENINVFGMKTSKKKMHIGEGFFIEGKVPSNIFTNRPEIIVRINGKDSFLPKSMGLTNILISPLNKNLKEVSEERFVFRGFTEMYFYEMLGLDTVILGPGLMEKKKKKNEYVPVENIKRFEDMLTKICRRTPRE